MNKISRDNQKAHNERMEVAKLFEKLFKNSNFWITKFTQEFKQIPPNQIKSLNYFFGRFPMTKMQINSIGHSFLLGNTQYPDYYRVVDIRFDNKAGLYWKDINSPASFEALKSINPIFIVVLKNDEGIISHLAGFDMNNPYLRNKTDWFPCTSIGNKNRLQNVKFSYSLKDQRGFDIINNKCEGIIEYLNKVFI